MNIQRTITSTIAVLLLVTSWGQNTIDDDKKYQVGLMTSLTMNWVKPQTDNLERDGTGVGFHGGVAFKYFFLKHNNIGISTGLFFDAESFKLNYMPGSVLDTAYYDYYDKDIHTFKDNPADSSIVMLSHRKYKPIYLTIPIALQFQTKLIGYFRYFGRFGINGSFLMNTVVDDQVYNVDNNLSTTSSIQSLEDLNTKNELEFVKSSLLFGAGMNWFFSGNTALHAEIQYNFGITNVFKGESRSLYTKNLQPYSEKMNQDMLVLKVGILF